MKNRAYLLLLISLVCFIVFFSSCRDSQSEYRISLSKIRSLVQERVSERLYEGGYTTGGFVNPISAEDVDILISTAQYQKALSVVLFEHYDSKEKRWNTPYLRHICELIAATKDKKFLVILEKARTSTVVLREIGVIENTMKVLNSKR